MKITKVDAIQIEDKPADQPGWRPIVCRVYTDTGLYGDGEAAIAYGVGSTAAYGMIQDLAKLIIGMNPLDTEVIWEKLYKSTFWAQNGGPIVFAGISALDIALWDIKGKYFNVPVYQLLGGKMRDKLRCYASQLQFGWGERKTPAYQIEDYVANAKKAVSEGYDAIKIDFFTFDPKGYRYSSEETTRVLEELGTILTETARQYFEEKQKNTYLNLSLKDYIIGWMIFEGQHFVESEQSHTLKGNYLMALFTDDFSDMAVEAAKLGRIWEHFYLYEEKHSLTVVLYQVSEKNAQKIYQMAQKENLNCYMSETFEDINDCRTKRDLLKQMERIPKICDVRGVKREKDWYLQGIFSYTLPLIEEAGLSDYSILNLIKEDEKNHTELYDTLKMYLLCENNVTMAAEKLHVHRNTLVYRLKQIKDCLELDINNNEISRELLAFMIMYDLSKSSED